MPNTLLTISMVTRELLMILKNNLVFSRNVDRRYEDRFAQSGAKIGATLNIRVPARFTVQSGPNLVVQNYVEETRPLVIDQQKHVDVEFSSVEMTLSLDDWSQRIGRPAAIKLANTIDRQGLELYWQVANSVMSPSTTPASYYYPYTLAGAIMDQEATPRDGDWAIVLDPMEQPRVINENKGLFQSSTQIKSQYERGIMGTAAGFDWAMDQNVVVHTVGPLGGAPLVGAAGQSGSTLATTGWTAAAAVRLNRGDVFTIDNVYAVNPQSLQTTGRLRQFTVMAEVSSTAGGAATIPIWPPITLAPDPRQTVNAGPAAGAAITVLGTAGTPYAQNLAYHKEAFTLAMVDLVQPHSGSYARVSDPEGFSMRSWKDSNIQTDSHPARIDVLFGWTTLRPETAVRIWSPMT